MARHMDWRAPETVPVLRATYHRVEELLYLRRERAHTGTATGATHAIDASSGANAVVVHLPHRHDLGTCAAEEDLLRHVQLGAIYLALLGR